MLLAHLGVSLTLGASGVSDALQLLNVGVCAESQGILVET